MKALHNSLHRIQANLTEQPRHLDDVRLDLEFRDVLKGNKKQRNNQNKRKPTKDFPDLPGSGDCGNIDPDRFLGHAKKLQYVRADSLDKNRQRFSKL